MPWQSASPIEHRPFFQTSPTCQYAVSPPLSISETKILHSHSFVNQKNNPRLQHTSHQDALNIYLGQRGERIPKKNQLKMSKQDHPTVECTNLKKLSGLIIGLPAWGNSTGDGIPGRTWQRPHRTTPTERRTPAAMEREAEASQNRRRKWRSGALSPPPGPGEREASEAEDGVWVGQHSAGEGLN